MEAKAESLGFLGGVVVQPTGLTDIGPKKGFMGESQYTKGRASFAEPEMAMHISEQELYASALEVNTIFDGTGWRLFLLALLSKRW